MLLFLKKKTDESEASALNTVIGDVTPPQEFVPYFAHYNPTTLLTKNGELMQVIKIASNNRGLNYESGEGTQYTIRDTIRRAITEAINSDKFSVWVHTLRKRTLVSYGGKFQEPFAAYVTDQWQKKSKWKYQYYNEIYISVLREGQSASMVDKHTLRHTLLPKRNRNFRNAFLNAASVELDQVTSAMLKTISQSYSGQRLSVVERTNENDASKTAFYSEPMEFLGTLLNLHTQEFPLPEADLGSVMCNHALTFGFNALEARNTSGQRRFGALLTLKQYREVTPEAVDRIMQFPIEFAISQAFHFTTHQRALKQYKEQKELFEMSGDKYSAKATGLDEMLKANQKRPTDYGMHQTSIMVLVDEYKQLEGEVRKAQEAFAELGMITVREDVKLEECFWAQLPGNFEFLRRKEAISTSKIGGFARLNLFPNGNPDNNHWGDALTLIPTQVNSPYFFNFHHQDNGHTAIFDFNSFHDQAGHILLNFLLTTFLKYQGRLVIFDRHHSAHLLTDKLDGVYHSLPVKSSQRNSRSLELNPFLLEPNKRNQGFLLAWCISLVSPALEMSDAHKEHLQAAIAGLLEEAPEHRSLNALITRLTALDSELGKLFSDARAAGHMTACFDTAHDNLDTSRAVQAFDMDALVKDRHGVVPVFSYLLHRLVNAIDGKPTIIVLHEAWSLLENPFFAPRLESLLEMLKQNNVAVIFTTSNPAACHDTATLQTLLQHCATHMYIPDDVAIDYAAQGIGLSPHDARMLSRMERQKGHCLLKHNEESIALNINLDEMDDIKAIFANDIKNLIAAGGRFASLPQES